MKISVVIVTRNRRDDLKVSLDAFLRQTYPNKEIVLIDNASTDGTREMIAQDYPGIKYLWLPDNFDIRSINLGIELSDGDIIWRTDDDSHPEKEDAFQKVAEIFRTQSDVHVIAMEDIEVKKNFEIWEWYPFKVDKENVPLNGYKSNFFPGAGAAIRKEVYHKIGGFWEFGVEEFDFCTRAIIAGFNVRYFPNIRVLHYASPGDRNNPNRWIQISKQIIRYNWRYFPFCRAFGRTLLIFHFQVLVALFSGTPILAIIEGMLTMKAVAISTFRKERNVVPKDKLYDITLGRGVLKGQIEFFKQKIRNKLSTWRKK
ncbi:MAG: glycosyltransferase [Bacteroidota bacterium]|jgi:hypothetical protein